MKKSQLLSYVNAAGLALAAVKLNDLNQVIFDAKLVDTIPGLTKSSGKHYRVDTKRNEALEITPATITTGANKALKKGKDADGYLGIAEDFGLIQEVSFKRADKDSDLAGDSLSDILRNLDLEVTDVTIEDQNDIIFKTLGVDSISDLTKDGKNFYQLNTRKNTATLIDPAAIAKQAKKDLLKGKHSDFTVLADNFNLISSITLSRKN